MENKSPELEVAIKAALEAGKILEKYFETEILSEYKEDNSPVTKADTESEEIIKKIICKEFPNHSILGEETGMTQNKSDYVWHIDPVDGTRNFANGIPIFGVSIALVSKDKVIVGVTYNPATKSLFYAEAGKGAYLNDEKILVSKTTKEKAIVTVSSGREKNESNLGKELFYTLFRNVVGSVRNLGCTAMELSYVARGGLEANIQIGFHTYDYAAGTLIISEAGGQITNFDGTPWNFPANKFIASNGVFHDVLVAEVQKQKAKLGIM